MFTEDSKRVRTAKRPVAEKLSTPLKLERHPFEEILSKRVTRRILGILSKSGKDGQTPLERIAYSYKNGSVSVKTRVKYAIPHKAIDYFVKKASVSPDSIVEKVFRHRPTIKALVNTARSISAYGLIEPQRFAAPLIVVWNFTQACNLSCKHCYQNATPKKAPDELTLEEKLHVVDQLADAYVPFLAFAGGEPFVDPDIWPILKRCQERGIHTTVATNGTMVTPRVAERLVECGVKYVEVSLDSIDRDHHDDFRGMRGAWAKTVEGIRTIARTPGLRCGMAACFTRNTVHQAPDMIEMAIGLGCSSFVHFNFIPVGRGLDLLDEDLTPQQREWLLSVLWRYLNEGKIGIMSTAPQFGRSCMMFADPSSFVAMGHAGKGKGKQAQVMSKYMGGCGACRCYCSFQPNGKVTPCVYIPHLVLGDLRKQSLLEIWNHPLHAILSDRNDRGDHCAVCDFRYFCGGCRARAESYMGDIQAGDPGCVYNMHLWSEILEKRKPMAGLSQVMPVNTEMRAAELQTLCSVGAGCGCGGSGMEPNEATADGGDQLRSECFNTSLFQKE